MTTLNLCVRCGRNPRTTAWMCEGCEQSLDAVAEAPAPPIPAELEFAILEILEGPADEPIRL